MEAEVRLFLSVIKDKTGVLFSVYDLGGAPIAGGEEKLENLPLDLNGVFADKENLRTLFLLNYKNKKYIAKIDGVGEQQSSYAQLIVLLAENAFLKESDLDRSEFLKALLMGECNRSVTDRYMHKFSMQDSPAFVIVIQAGEERIHDVDGALTTFGEEGLDFSVQIEKDKLAFVKLIDKAWGEYQSPTEYAQFLRQFVYEETGVSVKISIGGIVKSVAELSFSFAQAMATERMVRALGAKGEIHSFKEFVLTKMLEDIPKYKLNENLEVLLDNNAKEIFSDEEMLNTAEEFLENSLNSSETSRKLFLHRNTLTYRLDKIEKATGLNIRKFSDAVTFRLITILSRLVK